MASSSPEGGFATPAAAAISLALAVMASAVMALSVSALRQARADLARTQVEYALAGDQLLAAKALIESNESGRTEWRMDGEAGNVEVVAEPEALKVGLHAAAGLDDKALASFHLADVGQAREALETLAASRRQVADDIATVDSSADWRRCARSALSPYGAATVLSVPAADALRPGSAWWRVGQLWRIRVTSKAGWVDDRIVRFTGSTAEPVVVVSRDFSRGREMGRACDGIVG